MARGAIDSIPLFTTADLSGDTPRDLDAGLFLPGQDSELLAWFEKTIKKTGCRGLTTHFDVDKQLRAINTGLALTIRPQGSSDVYATTGAVDVSEKKSAVFSLDAFLPELKNVIGNTIFLIILRIYMCRRICFYTSWTQKKKYTNHGNRKKQQFTGFSSVFTTLLSFLFCHAVRSIKAVKKKIRE